MAELLRPLLEDPRFRAMPRDQQELFLCAAEKMLNRLVELDPEVVEQFVRTGDRSLVTRVLPTAT